MIQKECIERFVNRYLLGDKLNLSGWYKGIIGFKDKVIDLGRMEVRPRITEKELEEYYEECIEKLEEHSEYFIDQEAFEETRKNILGPKRAELIARDPVYPCIFDLREYKNLFKILSDPRKAKTEGRYFYIPRYVALIPLSEDSPYFELIDTSSKDIIKVSKEELTQKMFKPKIEIPNDRTKAEAKGYTFHETLHHFLLNYLIESRRLLTPSDIDLSKEEKYIVEYWLQESVVEELTDLLLEDDEEALFEERWLMYEAMNPVSVFLKMGTAISTGMLLGLGLNNPELLPLVGVPSIVKNITIKKYRESKREGITRSIRRREFKI